MTLKNDNVDFIFIFHSGEVWFINRTFKYVFEKVIINKRNKRKGVVLYYINKYFSFYIVNNEISLKIH